MNYFNPHPLVKIIHIPSETHEISLTSDQNVICLKSRKDPHMNTSI